VTDLAALVNPDCPGCQALLVLVQKQSQQIEKQSQQIEKQSQQIEELSARVANLEEQLAQTSQNSHRPPSQDPPKARAERPRGREKSGKKRGGQKGHKGSQRDLLPRDQVDHVEAVIPEACSDCGAVLAGTDPHPQRHQVTELPVIRPVVTEYELHALDCAHCGSTTRAGRPAGVPAGAVGPRLNALVG
jgi:transposase